MPSALLPVFFALPNNKSNGENQVDCQTELSSHASLLLQCTFFFFGDENGILFFQGESGRVFRPQSHIGVDNLPNQLACNKIASG